MKALLEVIPTLLVLYGTFLLGQVNQRRKYKDRRDPLPVIQAARRVVVAEQTETQSALHLSVAGLEIALDEWDLKPAS